ncbi:MAG: hypothetical protein FWG08_07345 [Propionibacteriaceae bacterium]|nr:hypothetical protein [Propionibacteriaceae bacterium]
MIAGISAMIARDAYRDFEDVSSVEALRVEEPKSVFVANRDHLQHHVILIRWCECGVWILRLRAE